MTKEEILALCAEAMGYEPFYFGFLDEDGNAFDPLTDDAQAMAMVKKFHLGIVCFHDGMWCANDRNNVVQAKDLNRAICECVAKMHKAQCERSA